MLIEDISKLFSTTPLIVIFCRDSFNHSGFQDFYVVKWQIPYPVHPVGVAPRRGLGGGIMILIIIMICSVVPLRTLIFVQKK